VPKGTLGMKNWLSELPRKLADHLVTRGLGLLVVAGLVALYFVVRDSKDVAVPPATLVAGAGLLVLLVIVGIVLWRRASKFEAYHGVHIAYTNVLNQALETLRKRAAHDRREVNVDEVIEKGILHPFRDLLQAIAGSDVRLSILVLDEQRPLEDGAAGWTQPRQPASVRPRVRPIVLTLRVRVWRHRVFERPVQRSSIRAAP
jgi:hypothetical protein